VKVDVWFGAMKLSAIATRGIRRDFWDAFVMAKSGHSLAEMAADFRAKFGKEASDLYHAVRALTYFDDAEADPIFPRGTTPALWKEVRTYFAREAPRLLRQLTQPWRPEGLRLWRYARASHVRPRRFRMRDRASVQSYADASRFFATVLSPTG